MVSLREYKQRSSLLAFLSSIGETRDTAYFLFERFPAPFLGGPFPLRRSTFSFAARRCSKGILSPGVAYEIGFVVVLVNQTINQSLSLLLQPAAAQPAACAVSCKNTIETKQNEAKLTSLAALSMNSR